MKKIKELYREYKEIINYLIFGGLTTIVSFITYYVVARVIGVDEVISNIIAWFCAVLFAYITNKLFVFDSKTETIIETLKEVISFFLARIVSGVFCDVGMFAVMVKVFSINDIFAKIVTQIIVVIVNYVFSKLIIFKKKSKNNT